MMKKSKINWLCLSGLLALVFYLLHDIIGAIYYPNYNFLKQAVSDLTAVDSESYVIANGLSSIYGIFSCLCCSIIFIGLNKNENKLFKIGVFIYMIMNYISAIGYSIFPLTSSGYDGTIQSFIHVYIITAFVVISSIISLIFIFIGAKENKIISYSAILSLIFMFLGSIGTIFIPKDYFGLVERFSTYSAVVFTAILGIYGFLTFDEYNK
mgnify:CR=1 FL=1